jgi:ATP-dependent RNA helicase RhlE
VDDVTHVINYELPNVPESYVHRIGRTARAGADGIAISFCDASERPHLRSIERLIKRPISVVGAVPSESSSPRQNGKSQAGTRAPANRQRRRRYRPAGTRFQ